MNFITRVNNWFNKLFLSTIIFFICSIKANAQSYHAINGSPFAGITSMYVNPASPVNSFYKWDASLIGIQFKTDQNSVFVRNLPISQINENNLNDTTVYPYSGLFSRHYHGIIDGQGLSFRYRIKDKTSIGISFRGRTYNEFKTNDIFISEYTKTTVNGFLEQNLPGHTIDGFAMHSGWMETNLNLSQVLIENSTAKLSVGANVGFSKALTGGYFGARNLQYQKLVNPTNNKEYYQALNNGGTLSYLYSNNLSYFDTVKVNSASIKQFYKNSYSSLNFSLGVEYMIVDETVEANISNLNYSWKFGASIMDIGTLKYDYIKGSATNRIPNVNFVDTSLETRFNNVNSLVQFRDSVSPMFDNTDSLKGSFTISAPTRIVASVDRNFGGGFFANFQASINIFSSNSTNSINSRELNLFTLTPRWETQGFGFYLPMQYNVQKSFWVGAAVKIGPLLLGVHDLGVLGWFKTYYRQPFNSGGYVMLNIYPYKNKYNDNSIKCNVL